MSRTRDDRDLADLNTMVTYAIADHQDMVIVPSQNPQTKMDFSSDMLE